MPRAERQPGNWGSCALGPALLLLQDTALGKGLNCFGPQSPLKTLNLLLSELNTQDILVSSFPRKGSRALTGLQKESWFP